ncbi:nucleotidyl transferase AbiEii/AbiGii toxin family protein [Acidipila rosea]|uniref:nucleotidyl transferase AbiEii/AbiGii toxin family protein n=1 Tax=Acidipila rosea TaxID=768535 RepID=UPI001A9D0034|nr:nucleotidyl transferase AbiEii/AbiGii toxin family protein [Acidipila rosea]
MAQERLRRWVSFLALCGVLERAVSEGVLTNYYLKGGVAMELRFAEGARATKDIDIGVAGKREERLRVFQDAIALGFDDFTFQVKGKPLSMDKVDAVRLELAVRFKTRAWQTIEVDLGSSGEGAVDLVEPAIPGLAAMGLRIPSPVRCLNLSEQVAQKLHACTGPYSQGRARDVLDILLVDLLGKLDITAVRLAAKQVFTQRATHDFPPSNQLPTEWQSELEALANELGYPATSATEIEARFRAFVDLIADWP